MMGYDGAGMVIYGLIYNLLKSIHFQSSVLHDLYFTQSIFTILLSQNKANF